MIEVPAVYFDGRTSRARAAVLRWRQAERVLVISADGVDREVPREGVTVDSRLGNTPRYVRFADGSRCEVADNDALDRILDEWMPDRSGRWLHRIETSWRWVLGTTVVLTAICAAVIYWGLPWGAKKLAFALPPSVTMDLGDRTLAALDRAFFKPTKLTHERQLALREAFAKFLAASGDTTTYRIEFRAAEEIGANALALPSGTIVFTDELVMMAKDDRELIGVLAHECGHVQRRHALRGVLQNSAVFVVVALVTGDLSSASLVGGALPAYLLEAQFSREFEREADLYAVEKLRAAKVDPGFLADMLARLGEKHGEDQAQLLAYLRTHPPTPERILYIRSDGKLQVR